MEYHINTIVYEFQYNGIFIRTTVLPSMYYGTPTVHIGTAFFFLVLFLKVSPL